ncbi:MAG: YggT family protein [Sphaerochaetaceae bacterium]
MRDFARMLAFILSIYNMLIIVRILLLWIRIPQMNLNTSGISGFLEKVVDPYLGIFKRISILHTGRLDFTPLAALMVLSILQRILQTYALTGDMTFGYILAIILQSLWYSIGSFVLGLLCILLGIRLFFCYRKTVNSIQYISMLNNWLNRIVDPIHRVVFGGKEVSDRLLYLVALILMVMLYVALSIGVNLLTNWLMAFHF